MPASGKVTNTTVQRKITRKRTGCKPCRRRGKKCDEAKPRCRACVRLSLECNYGLDLTFRHVNGDAFRGNTIGLSMTPTSIEDATASDKTPGRSSYRCNRLTPAKIATSLGSGDSLESFYLTHFQSYVRHLLPASSMPPAEELFTSPYLRAAALCISASNLSMLNTQVQSRIAAGDGRSSIFSPRVNPLHHRQARNYHDHTLQLCRYTDSEVLAQNAAAILRAHVLLAYYHHASTNHLNFRLAVWDTLRFVSQHREQIMRSVDGIGALQMWHRLCVSHRLSKPPSLLLEGEGISSFGPNCFPDPTDHLYLSCVLGMSTDDLIYDILIKTMEIRSRLVVFRSVAGSRQIPELSRDIGSVAHKVLNEMLGRNSAPDEYAEAQEGFVRGSHLIGLLAVQMERLEVWKSRINESQLPMSPIGTPPQQQRMSDNSAYFNYSAFRFHRDAMNAIYSNLCEMMFEEAHGACSFDGQPVHETSHTAAKLTELAHSVCQIVGTLDFTASSTADVYTFSLTETLLQLVFLWRSDTLFDYILNIVWPGLERKTRGFEHSHYPTHLVKRMISQSSTYWSQGRAVTLALPAVPEDISKLKLLDIDNPIDVVLCGHDTNGTAWIEKIPLP
ncbi:Zn(II)2Cys6 transcription factor domain-containing protein [Aspergillus homomorphus CBS 101889]|uniref:Zn(2)-C6 fungal-type domain-containing protein n=1 Tax=Aspergillus homomorphus (strain CBS 101889) TaxID=1450537 RepID=A0A395HRU8_ASPHC|nr:hypothetical protein BO97DRAFT_471488 [Aspergillus homomorphus CBS 101889]RAL10662.1 hypothetical protein BO97DRAFT_471488 [Aspergillus homomorphus CBS 101889]